MNQLGLSRIKQRAASSFHIRSVSNLRTHSRHFATVNPITFRMKNANTENVSKLVGQTLFGFPSRVRYEKEGAHTSIICEVWRHGRTWKRFTLERLGEDYFV